MNHFEKEGNKMATESQARHAAKRAGYLMRKSRRKFSIDNLGDFQLRDPRTNFVVCGSRFDMSPDDVMEFCREDTECAAQQN